VVAGIETRNELMNKRALTNRLVTVGESIREGLQVMAISRGGHITLLEAVKFGLELNNPVVLVGVEEVVDLLPDRVRRRIFFHGHVHEVISECGMKPHEDSKVGLHPRNVIGTRLVDVDMLAQIKSSKDDVKGVVPARIGIGLHIKSYRHKTLDIDILGGVGKGRRCCGGGRGGASNL
jgi:hypothetical protein